MQSSVQWDPKGKVWFVRPYSGRNKITGKRHRRKYKSFPSATSREEAQEMADAWIADREDKAIKRYGLTFKENVEFYLDSCEKSYAPSTASSYRSMLRKLVAPTIGKIPMGDIDAGTVQDWQSNLQRLGYKNTYINKCRHFLSKAWTWLAVAQGKPEAINPFMQAVRVPDEKHVAKSFTPEQAVILGEALEAAMAEGSSDDANVKSRMRAFAAYLSLHTGMRLGEVCALTVDDVDLLGERIIVSKSVSECGKNGPYSKTTKTGRSRVIAMSPEIKESFESHLKWLATLRRSNGWGRSMRQIITYDGSLLRPSKLSNSFSKLRDELGLPKDTHFHTLRHTHASFILSNRGSLKQVQERLGHASPSMTLEIYAHTMPAEDLDASNKFEASMKEARDVFG